MSILKAKNGIEGSTIKVVNHPNLFWSNYSRDKPNHFMPFNEFKEYEYKGCKKFKIDWSIEEPYHGQIKLLDNWNYAIIDGNMYFLEVKKSFGNKLYLYECIYDFWVNLMIRQPTTIIGTLGNTSSAQLALDHLQTTTPMLLNPNGQRIIPIRIKGERRLPQIIASSPHLYMENVYQEQFDPGAIKIFQEKLLSLKNKTFQEDNDDSMIKLCLFSWYTLTWKISFMRTIIQWLENNKHLLKVYDLITSKVGFVENIRNSLQSQFSKEKFYAITTDSNKIFANTHNSSLHITKLDFSPFKDLKLVPWSKEKKIWKEKLLNSENTASQIGDHLTPQNLENFKLHTNTNSQYINGYLVSGDFRIGEVKDESNKLNMHTVKEDGQLDILVGLKDIPKDFDTRKTEREFLNTYGVYEKINVRKGEVIIPLDKYVLGKENSKIENFLPQEQYWTPAQWEQQIKGVFKGNTEDDISVNRDSFLGDSRFEKSALVALPDVLNNKQYYVGYLTMHQVDDTTGEAKYKLPWPRKYMKIIPLETSTTQDGWKNNEEFFSYTSQSSSATSNLADISTIKEEKDYYSLFIRSLITIMMCGIWWDKPYWDLWIYKVWASFPEGKWTDTNDNLIKSTAQASKTPKFEHDDTTKKVNEIYIQLDREVVNKLNSENEKVKSGEVLSRKLADALSKMGKLFYQFFRKDWSSGWIENEHVYTIDVKEFYKATMYMNKETVGNLTYHVLNFVRVYEGRFYRCRVYFQGEGYTTQIRSHYIYYVDKLWNRGGYYQANGAYASSRIHIGGMENKAKKQGYEWTEIDAQLSKCLENFENQPWITWKWIYILGKAGYTEEARKSFNATKYWQIKQKTPPISKENSWSPEYYKKIHPLAELFYKTNEELAKTNNTEQYLTALIGLDKLKTQHKKVILDSSFNTFELQNIATQGLPQDLTKKDWWEPKDIDKNDVVIFEMEGINDMLIAVHKDSSENIKYEILITDSANIIGQIETQDLELQNTQHVTNPAEIINQANTLYCFGTRFPLKFRAKFENKALEFPQLTIQGMKVEGESKSEYRRLVLDSGYDYIDTVISYLKKETDTKQIDFLEWEKFKMTKKEEERRRHLDALRLQMERSRFYEDWTAKRELWNEEGHYINAMRGEQDAKYNRDYGFGIANAILGPVTSVLSIVASPLLLAGRALGDVIRGIGGSAFRSKGLMGAAVGGGSGQIMGGVQSMLDLTANRRKQLIERGRENYLRNAEMQKMQRENERSIVDYKLARDDLETGYLLRQWEWKNEIIAMNSAVNVVQTTDSDIHEAYNKLLMNWPDSQIVNKEGKTCETINTYLIQQYPKGRVLDQLEKYYKEYGYEVLIPNFSFNYSNQTGLWKFTSIQVVSHPSPIVKRELTKIFMSGINIRPVTKW